MFRFILKLVFVLVGAGILRQAAAHLLNAGLWLNPAVNSSRVLLWASAIGAVLGLIIGPRIINKLEQAMGRLISSLNRTSPYDLVVGAAGLVVGLLIGILATLPIPDHVPIIGEYVPLVATLTIGYIAMAVALKKKEELLSLFNLFPRSVDKQHGRERRFFGQKVACKILDTSVIIDGRIADICRTGFLEGTLIVPGFVLEELQRIADSSDVLKRNRGRRGLDILNKMQKEPGVTIKIDYRDFDDIAEVDTKLLRLAKVLGAKVVTNDYNLNKVAELQGIPVLNINELANAVKPIVLPGEEMVVHVIKDGKEQGQGVAYLDDGTMIVVDGGRKYIGEDVGVMVTSVLQTAAGRMIFAKPKAMEKAL
ncbi:MAG TPA: PIN/TRAM domain-containing protein [Firmicutes bacterium]|nr:PIN/TRAM domain-containing protein [Bacillota bacterium]